jgi:hypothetical protein
VDTAKLAPPAAAGAVVERLEELALLARNEVLP